MTITVELFRRDLAEVTFRPSLWRRVLLRQDAQIMFAVRSVGGGWHWDHSGHAIHDQRVLEKLVEASRHADFDRMARSLARAQRDYSVDDLHVN